MGWNEGEHVGDEQNAVVDIRDEVRVLGEERRHGVSETFKCASELESFRVLQDRS